MRSAIVHDWLTSPIGGSENVLESIHRLFPSPIYTLLTNKAKLKNSYFQDLDIISSFIQKLPFAIEKYRNYLPLFPAAIERVDLTNFDLLISSSHCVAKGIIKSPKQLHICYCHTPVRYAWDLMEAYLSEANLDRGIKGMIARRILYSLRSWDARTAKRVDFFIANSRFVANRIEKFYGRQSEVIYPPVDIQYFQMKEKKENYYVTASRLVQNKKVGLIVGAFSHMPDKKLVVIGDGPEWEKIKKTTTPNVELLGFQTNDKLKEILQNAKAFLFASEEDFGIAPVEAMATGTPVIAYGRGGALETVLAGETGLFYEMQTEASLINAIKQFEKTAFNPQTCRHRAEQFSQSKFDKQLQAFVLDKYTKFKRLVRTYT